MNAFLKTLSLTVVLVLATSCSHERTEDERLTGATAAGPGTGAGENTLALAHTLFNVTSSKASENLHFCPSPDAKWAVLASDWDSANLKLYRKDLTGPGRISPVKGAQEGNNVFPALTNPPALLAFASDRDGCWRIYTLRLGPKGFSTGAPTPVTAEGEDCLCPAWDPKSDPGGERLAFCKYNVRDKRWEVWLLDLKGGQLTYVCKGRFPAWSPDGDRLAVQRASKRGSRQFRIWLVSPSGPAERVLVSNESWAACNPCWSPDGKWIAFNTVGRGENQGLTSEGGGIYYVRVTGGGRSPYALPGPCRNSWRPSWGSDGRIYFHHREGEAVNVLAVRGPRLELSDRTQAAGDKGEKEPL